jgi:hypothetical protein
MKLVNTTRYDNRQLKQFIHRALVSIGVNPKDRQRKIITVVPSRRRTHWGCAPYGGMRAARWMKLSLPALADLDLAQAYRVIRHENAHNLGIKHGEMADDLRWCHGSVPEWIAAASIAYRAERPSPSKEDVTVKKLEQAQQRLKTAQTAVKRATTRLKKWQHKVKHYEGRLAAFTSGRVSQPPQDLQ